MFTRNRCRFVGGLAAALAFTAWVGAQSQDKAKARPKEQEQERKVKESEVPKAALEALKKQAAGAAITEFSEEIEHGSKFYEGSWKTAAGKVDVLVTESGALVEIEERVSADQVPAAVMAAAKKAAGDAAMSLEKKTEISYEVHFKKGDKHHELVITPDGRQQEHEEGDADEDD